VLTAGVDLAAEPKGTALAVMEWRASKGTLVELHVGNDDARIVEAASRVEKLGIDCAFGWPIEFVEFVANHSADAATAPDVDGGMDWRRQLSFRETDRAVREITGRWPLSVSTDRLGLTAMRCAGLLARLTASGISVDRAGSGVVVEVYPGATIRMWGFDTAGYRTSSDARARLLDLLCESAPWFDAGLFAPLMLSSCDAFDAVIAAMASRSAARGSYTKPSAAQLDRARREGWIALPTGSLSDVAVDTQEGQVKSSHDVVEVDED